MSRTESGTAMRIGRHFAQRVLLRTGAGERSESGPDAAVGRVAFGTSGVWQPALDGLVAARGAAGESQARGSVAGVDGRGSHLSQAELESAWRRASDLSVPLGRAGNQRPGPGMVQRHHVCADGPRVHVSGGGDGLVEI